MIFLFSLCGPVLDDPPSMAKGRAHCFMVSNRTNETTGQQFCCALKSHSNHLLKLWGEGMVLVLQFLRQDTEPHSVPGGYGLAVVIGSGAAISV